MTGPNIHAVDTHRGTDYLTLNDLILEDSPWRTTEWPDVDETHAAAHSALLDIIGSLEAAGFTIPCRNPLTGHLWTLDDDYGEGSGARIAAQQCRACPLMSRSACSAYISAHPEPAGVWAATTAADRRRDAIRARDRDRKRRTNARRKEQQP
ncbi:WhiB family transcriptional regulator [Georgenia sp. AZ-5]|uniref:WhiB family transcriptional regulator n=1 Tax=Georgenia sp. AZ-5 TaxID=3367526 RepID=UPI003754F0AF